MFGTKVSSVFAVALLLLSIDPMFASGRRPRPSPTATPSAPPAPVLVSPANGASLVQPITLDWDPVSAPGGPIGSYTWQIGTTSALTTVIASGFTNMDSDPNIPTRTADKVSGLPNGTYFWRVKCTATWPERRSRFAVVNGAIVHCNRPRTGARHALVYHAGEQRAVSLG